MSVLRNQLKSLVKLGFYCLGSLGNQPRIPVLMYHSIDDTGSVISVSRQVFRKHLQYLKDRGFETVSLREYFNTPPSQTAKKVLITFDDGYQNIFSHALPILKEFSYKATVFLVTDCIGKTAEWIIRDQKIILDRLIAQFAASEKEKAGEIEKLKTISQFQLLSWEEIQEMKKEGIEFQSHSHTHPFASEIGEDQVKLELEQSQLILKEKLGQEINIFGYPYTDYNNPYIIDLLRKTGYQGAFIGDQFPRKSGGNSDFLISRLPLWEESSLFDLAFSLSPGYRWYKVCLQKVKGYKGNEGQPSPGY